MRENLTFSSLNLGNKEQAKVNQGGGEGRGEVSVKVPLGMEKKTLYHFLEWDKNVSYHRYSFMLGSLFFTLS